MERSDTVLYKPQNLEDKKWIIYVQNFVSVRLKKAILLLPTVTFEKASTDFYVNRDR